MNEYGPEITKSEVIHAINIQKNGKATGQIHAEVLKLIAEQEGTGLIHLTSLFNKIYNTERISINWLRSTFITLPKKTNVTTIV